MAFNQINQKNVKLQMKQPFVGVLQNSDRKKILQKKKEKEKEGKIYRKTTVLESLFKKVADFQLTTLLKVKLQHRCFLVSRKIFKNTFLQKIMVRNP